MGALLVGFVLAVGLAGIVAKVSFEVGWWRGRSDTLKQYSEKP